MIKNPKMMVKYFDLVLSCPLRDLFLATVIWFVIVYCFPLYLLAFLFCVFFGLGDDWLKNEWILTEPLMKKDIESHHKTLPQSSPFQPPIKAGNEGSSGRKRWNLDHSKITAHPPLMFSTSAEYRLNHGLHPSQSILPFPSNC